MKRGILCTSVLWLLAGMTPVDAGELSIGDPAPALDVLKWVKGEPVDLAKAQGERIVVVEFWATWCGPCIASIPHLTELQHEFGKKGVTIIGMTKHDDNNAQETVEKFVADQGDKMDYTVAFEQDPTTYDAWMKAAGQNGIPTSFVIDKSGRVAWIGHPMNGLDEVLEEIVGGTYDIAIAKRVFEIKDKMREAMFADEHETRLTLADEWISLKPADPSPHMTKFRVLSNNLDKPEEALAAARQAVKLANDKAETLASIAQQLLTDDDQHGFNDLAFRAVERALTLAPDDVDSMIAQFRVLAAMDRESDAIRSAEQTIKKIKTDPAALARFARVLSSPPRAERCTALALEAVDLAITAEPETVRHLVTKFDILANCKKDLKAAEAIGRYVVEKAGENDEGLLNGFAWNLLTADETKGKFSTLALAAAERCDTITDGENWMYVDTLALAKFETGSRDEAVALQKQVVILLADKPATEEVLDRLIQFASDQQEGNAGLMRPLIVIPEPAGD
ncbi:MAG: redoxin family protein [Planctomycetes bacterium]|nr:redoxin family protein [Planctomycetota bacterium]